MTPEQQAEVMAVIPRLPELHLLRLRSKNWTIEMFDFAVTIYGSGTPGMGKQVLAQLLMVRSERMQEAAEQNAINRELVDRETAAARHQETLKETREGTAAANKTLWWTRWVVALTVVIVILTICLLVFAPK
jgi:hypothetical protein